LPKLLLQRYEVRRRLGAGGMGVVYEATDTVLGRAVALKTLPRLSQESADRLMTEARTMAALSHTSLAVLFGAERWRGTPVLVMEYLVSGTLADRLRRSRLSPSAAVQLVRQLTAALEYVHNAGLYHGDIKPSNVGLTADDSPKFLDFGLSRALTETADGIGADDNGGPAPLGGTPAYLSPEVRAGEPVTAAMDLWALGLLFCESLLGKHPALTASSPRELQRDLGKAMNELSTFIAPELCAIIAALLTTDPRQRLSTASELRRALDALSPTTLSHGTNSLLP
jgi:serine/threonine protein kinase